MKERRDVTRTKNAIEHAYLELLFRKGYSRITVNEVIELADVSRGTFYAHYKDIPDLEDRVEDKAVTALREACEAKDAVDILSIARDSMACVFKLFYSFKEDFKQLVVAENNTKMLNKIKNVLADAINHSGSKKKFAEAVGEQKASMLVESIAGSFVSGFIYFVRHEDEFGRDEAASIMSDFISGGIEKSVEIAKKM